jgi:hypothetical protein
MTQQMKWTRDREYEAVAHQRQATLALDLAEALKMPVETIRESMALAPPPLAYGLGENLRALVGREPVGRRDDGSLDMRWHISVNGAHAGAERLPTWHEMVQAAHELRPGVAFVIGVPPRSHWMAEVRSGHYVLHLWETRDETLARSWMEQRTPGGRAPS